jgi:protein-S-isoprenylcysteine O-methyltransferase Ste14
MIVRTVLNISIPACWIIFYIYWIIRARGVKPAAEEQTRLSRLAHRLPLALCVFLLLCPFTRSPLALPLTPQTVLTLDIGTIVCVLGLLITIWARRTLAGNWSSDVTFKQGHELIQAGPYRYARHPIYTGLLVMCLGTAMAGGRLHSWLGLLFMGAAFWIKIRQEESLMLRHFPDQYPAYRVRVKAIVPFVI